MCHRSRYLNAVKANCGTVHCSHTSIQLQSSVRDTVQSEDRMLAEEHASFYILFRGTYTLSHAFQVTLPSLLSNYACSVNQIALGREELGV